MKVALVVKYYPPVRRVSGIIGFLTVLNRALARRVELHVITARIDNTGSRRMSTDGYTVHRVSGPFPLASAKKVRQLSPDAVVFVSGIHNVRMLPPYIALFGSMLPRRATSVFYQATQVDASPGKAVAAALCWADRILVASTHISQRFQTQFNDKPVVFAPAVEVPSIGDRSGPITVGFVNHFNSVKGLSWAITAIRAVLDADPTARAIIAGEGPDEHLVRRAFDHHERVEIYGFLEDAERLKAIEQIDIMVLPFATEVSVLGVSQTVLEVMAAGNVVVGSRTDAITAAIVDKVNGLLGEPGELADLAVRCAAEEPLRDRLGTQAHRDAQDSWGIERRADQLEQLLAMSASR